MTFVSLSEMRSGEMGRICGFHAGDISYRRRLLAMGLTPNTHFQLVRRAPLGDPVQIRLHDYSLSIRQGEAHLLKIERIE